MESSENTVNPKPTPQSVELDPTSSGFPNQVEELSDTNDLPFGAEPPSQDPTPQFNEEDI